MVGKRMVPINLLEVFLITSFKNSEDHSTQLKCSADYWRDTTAYTKRTGTEYRFVPWDLSLEAISRLNPDLLGTVLIQIYLHGTCKLRRNVLSISNSPCSSQTEDPWKPSFSAKFSRDDCTFRKVPSGCSGFCLQRYGTLNLCRVPPQTWHLEAPHPLWVQRAVSVLGVASAPTSGERGRAVCGMTAPGSD